MTNPYEKWSRYHISDEVDLLQMEQHFIIDAPLVGGADTETTGLHIIKDKPFLIQFGWLVPKQDFGRVFTFYPTTENMKVFFELARKLKYLVAHNIKYDLSMLSNIGYAEEVQAMTNLCDSMAVARLALEAIPAREGGDSLKLKKLGEKYVHIDATRSEKMIDDEMTRLRAEGVKVLTAALKQFDHPEDMEHKVFRKDTGAKTTKPYAQANKNNVEWRHVPAKWNKKRIMDFLKDPTNDVDLLPDDVKEVWLEWQQEYPEPTYEDVNRDIMIKYGAEDIITMLEFFKKAYPYVKDRNQIGILQLENDCILPTYRMERVGLKVDREYLENSRIKVQAYIRQLREEMYTITEEKITVNQHPSIKRIFKDKFGIVLESDDAKAMKGIMKEYTGAPNRLALLIKTLRSLEKWYSTYIKRILHLSEYDGRVYTQINLNGAVSGRMSSDFQQFPKKALHDLDGNVLYHPRKAFTPKGEGYDSIVYIDYDQIELVTQAHYTLLVSGGDLNLCRAYMPFRCHHYKTGEIFDYRTSEGRHQWNEKQPSGDSVWIDEQGKPWTKTDVHAQTTHKAFPTIPLGTPEFKEWRSKGKLFNFLANYGGGKGAAIAQLDLKDEEADALVRGYNEAFPHVRIYQDKIVQGHASKGYVHNHFGRRYYISDKNRAYKLSNYVVQGTCADAMKKAIIDLDKYLLDKKSKMVIPIHDEVNFDIYKGEEWIIMELLKIMQEAFDWCLVPVTAGVEVTYTNWSEKSEMSL